MDVINHDDQCIHKYLDILQMSTIRMASNSSSCKSWCITIISAMMVVIVEKQKSQLLFATCLPIFLFFTLDAYYLSLEKCIRDNYNDFIKKVHSRSVRVSDLYIIKVHGNAWETLLGIHKCALSVSVLPFYLLTSVMVGLVWYFLK